MVEEQISSSKICPLSGKSCFGQQCSVWIKIWKPHEFPGWRYKYCGCGLVHTIPWILRWRKKGVEKE